MCARIPELTMVRGRGSPQDQVRHPVGVLDGILLGEEPAKAPPADDGLFGAGKVRPDRLDVLDDLTECVRPGGRALAVAPIVERQDPVLVAERPVRLEVGPVVSWTPASAITAGGGWWAPARVLTHPTASVQCYHERRARRPAEPVGQVGAVDLDKGQLHRAGRGVSESRPTGSLPG